MENENFKKNIRILNYAFSAIVITAVLIILIASIRLIFFQENTQKIALEINYSPYSIMKTDSTMKQLIHSNDVLFKKIDSLIKNQKIREDEILESAKKQSEFVSFVSGIFALILTLAGFFGFKSIFEIKHDAIEQASQDAKKVSKIITKNVSKNAINAAIKKAQEVTDNYVSEYALKQMKNINEEAITNIVSKYIAPLEDQINDIKSGQNFEISEKESNGDEQPFKNEEL